MVLVRRPLPHRGATLGETLRALRRTQAVTMDVLVARTHVQRKYLEALEWGRYDELPPPLYARNFVRAYARALQADERYFLDLFQQEAQQTDLLAPHRLPRARARFSFWQKQPLRRLAVSFIACLGLLVFFSFQIFRVLAPPKIQFVSPASESVVAAPEVTFVGVIDRELETFVIAGQAVSVHDDKTFSVVVPLHTGMNHLDVTARRRYSREFRKSFIVVYQPVE